MLISKTLCDFRTCKMELSYILCALVLCGHFLDFFTLVSVAAVSCPVRAIPVSAPEDERGYKCVCLRDYYGTNCRFKARNRNIDADVGWPSEKTMSKGKLTWRGQYGEAFHVSVRKVSYQNGTMIASKWSPAKLTSAKVEIHSNTLASAVLNPGTAANFSVELEFPRTASYEIYLSKITSTSGDVNGSLSVFLDTWNTYVYDEINISRNRNNTTVKECSWLKCPGQFFHVTNIMKDFGKPSFIDGVIFAVPVTILGSLLIGTLICVILRQCKRKKNLPASKPSDAEKVLSSENVAQKDANDEIVKSCVIEMSEIDIVNSASPKEGAFSSTEEGYGLGQGNTESCVVSIEDIKAPFVHGTDDESMSQSRNSSLTIVTAMSMSNLSITCPSEGEFVLPTSLV